MTKYFTKIISNCLFIGAFSLPAMAAPSSEVSGDLYLKETVDLTIDNRIVATAYHDSTNCLVWKYVPAYLTTSPKITSGADVENLVSGDKTYTAYLESIDFTGTPKISAENLEAFRTGVK